MAGRISAVKTLEKIATLVHTQWSIWQEHQDKCKIQNNAGTIEFDDGTWQDWNRKANTPFKFLTEEEKKSDYELAKKLWVRFHHEILKKQKQLLEEPKK